MESPRPDEDTSAVPEQQQQQQQQDVPTEAEGFVASPEPGAEGATTSPAEPGPEAVFEVAPEDVDTSAGLGAEDPTGVPLDYVPPPEDRGEDVPLDYVPPPEDRGGDVPPDYVPGAEAPTAVPVDDAPEGYIPDYSWLNDPAEPVPEYIAEDFVPTAEPGAEDVIPEDVDTSPAGPGAEEPEDEMTIHPSPGFEEPEDEMTIHPSPGFEEPDDEMTIHPSPGLEEPTNVPIDESLEGYIPDYGWRDNPPEPMPEDIAEDVTDPLTGPGTEYPTDIPLDYVPPPEDRGEDVPLDYVPPPEDGGEGVPLDYVGLQEDEPTDLGSPIYQEPTQGTEEDLTQPLGDVDWQATADTLSSAEQHAQERLDSVGEHKVGEYVGEENAKLIMDAQSQIQDTVADAIEDPTQAAEDLSQVLDDVSELTVDDVIAADQWGQERVDSFAEHWVGEYVGEENAKLIMDARSKVQDIEEQGLDNVIADVDAGNWLQAFDHVQGTVDDVATTYLGVGIGEEAAESVVQGYRDYQDTVSELGAEAVEGVVDTIGDVFDW